MKHLYKIFKELGIEDKETVFIEHHLAHASCAYRSSPWPYDEQVLIFTADGAGDGLSSTVSIGEKGEINRIAESIYYDSLGNVFYSEITRYLGMKPWDHEYKVMGLAPYGKPEYCIDKMKRIIRLNPRNPLEFQNRIRAYCEGVQPKLRKLLAGQRFDNIAAAAQLWFEELIISWIRYAIEKTDIHKIACAGGLFLNVKANKRIMEMPEVEDAFFYPAAGDDGTPVGAALQGYYEFCKAEGLQPRKVPLADVYYGPSYSNDEIRDVLKNTGWISKAEFYDDIDSIIGELVVKGKIVARFSGRLEWGPRALGNRSILADARDMKIVRRINSAIKQRDFWMPFAPTILEERMNDYLVNARTAPYMILAFDTTEKRDEIIAAIHPYDYTCRPQTLNDSWNPGYRKILEIFEKSTGVGGLLNTSFNLHGYPIVCTPEQALWTFERSELDALAIGNYLIKRN
jgi:carbamoyltransferase